MHYYRVYKRSETNGKPIKTSIYGKKGSIDLANAYVYSGVATALEGSKRKLTPDRPPRLFQNGVTSNDTDQECTFTIWIPKRKRMFSSRRQRIIVHGYENRMNSKGVRWVFLAPSRKERDEWVFSINVIHEQLLREASRY
ncbi:hypothetical protein BJ944DRAFT_5097 [Cunninghamella echinulata]|nr:hypothetical protein BJ944DRAFT_5097 [Cunninghamella echinulata]